jgi:abhydrolase domain-containing protein 5
MINRLLPLKPENPITFIYGWNSWIDRQPGLIIKEYRNQSTVDLFVLGGASYHVYADRSEMFNMRINRKQEGS